MPACRGARPCLPARTVARRPCPSPSSQSAGEAASDTTVGLLQGEAGWCLDRGSVCLASVSRWRLSAGNLWEDVSPQSLWAAARSPSSPPHKACDSMEPGDRSLPPLPGGRDCSCPRDIRAGTKGFHRKPRKYSVLPGLAAGIKVFCFLFFPFFSGG